MPVDGLTVLFLFLFCFVFFAERDSVNMPLPPLWLGLGKREREGWDSSFFSKRGPGSGFLPRLAQPSALQLRRSGQLAGELHFLGPRLPSYLREP